MGHFSPRAFAAAISRTVIRRAVLAPPYSGSGVVRGPVAAMDGEACSDIGGDLRVSCRPSGVPGQLDDGMATGPSGTVRGSGRLGQWLISPMSTPARRATTSVEGSPGWPTG